jgi:hypothetical protein
MNKMNLPGFTAGVSLYQSSRLYHTAGIFGQNGRSSVHLAQVGVITQPLDPSVITSPSCVEVWFPKYCYRLKKKWIGDMEIPYPERYLCGHEPCKICSDGTLSCP